ncbi:MAG TPA: peroxiredoxin [Thiobacillus sp.]|nr:MAG: peroxiredoxin [Hydrogenophilales bacterium 28-61-11]OYZ57004.1 MAG: peroxiredoxin [Hydrogenophilales bacterium 16-61-112]OZA48106.1 MAG: peroxiredoxin [Hydrogenophilales bacterium 17-61-76]HQT31231.1 peroxiredoxin [Thiobacillus sp.]HQT69805.1 peroxiredoxin [Thiobacillus sp.]
MSDPVISDFELPATSNSTFKLSEHRGKNVVVFFYPKDDTPGCTLEGQEFRDLYADFGKVNTTVVGVSRDTLQSHEDFKAKFEFPFELLADTEEKACELFGVMKLKNMYGKQVRGVERSTFVFDAEGKLVKSWRGLKAPGHAAEVLAFVQTL